MHMVTKVPKITVCLLWAKGLTTLHMNLLGFLPGTVFV